MDSKKKEELLKRQREARQKQKSCNKENEVPAEDSEWLSRNDNYQRQSIHMPFQGQENIPTGMDGDSIR
jgi:predicted HNH restriction endonuclease